MDSIIPLGQKNTLAKYMILSGVDNRLPMLDKDLYDSWKSIIELYMQNREHGRMILESVEYGPLIWPTIEENGVTRTKKYAELSAAEKIQADCDMKATNIILQGLPADIYSLVNHHRVAKDLWERVQLLMQGTSLTKQERECKLLPPEWSKFVTDVKLVKDLHTTNFDQLHAYLEQHELYANEVRLMRERNQDPLALVANHQMTPPHFNTYQSSYNNPSSTTVSTISIWINSSHSTLLIYLSIITTIQSFIRSTIAMAFLTAIASSRFPSTNNQLRTFSNPRNQATIQDGKFIVQQVQGRQRQNYSSTGYKSNVTSSGGNNANPGIPDGQAVQTIIPNNAAFQTEDLDTYDSDCDDVSNAKAVLMANISNYGSDIISEVPHSETYLNDMENQSVHGMHDFKQTLVVDVTDNEITSDSNIIPYSQYLQETQQVNVQDTNLQAQQDSMILSVIEQMSEQMINHVNNWEKANKEQNNESVTAELERYKERVKTFEQCLNIDLSSREKMIDSQMDDMIKEKLALKEQVDSLEQNLSKQIKEKESLLQTFTVFKNESKEKENKYMENEIDLEKKIKELDNIIFKVGQSAQTVHMLTKPQVFYDNAHKQALGYQNPFYLKKAQRIKPTLYDGIVISDKHVAMPVIDDEETLILEEESRSKMSEKEKDPEAIKQNISHKPIDYVKLNRLSEDFRKHFTPQQELSDEQTFWYHMLNSSTKSFDASHVKMEAPKELHKVSLVNESLKKLKFHLAKFDNVVKIRTTPDARTEGEWGFEHNKAIFNNEIIPFLKSLKDFFNVFDKDLLNEITEVQTVFDQMEVVVQQSSVDKQCLKIAKKELLLENDRLLQQIMSQDVFLTVMNSMSLNGESVNMERKRNESCDKCFNLDAELLKTQNQHNDLLKSYSQLEKHCMFKLDLEPLAPRLLQNREAHIDYLKYTQEQADILREIVKQAKAKQPLDNELDFACKHAQRIQELLVYVRDTCPNAIKLSAKKVESSKTSYSNTHVLSPTGLKCSTSNCGSKPTGNKKNDRISRTPSRNMKNKVEAQPRKVNKKNSVVEPIRDVDVKHSLLNANSEPICATCKKSMFDGVHDMCLLDFVENVNSHAKSAKKHKKQNIWKPTGHVFTEVRLKWKPISITFTIVGNSCPLTRITSANVVPPKKTTSHSVETQKPELKVYSRKPKNVKNVGSSKKAKIVESKNANHSEPNHTWGSNATDIPSSSSLVMTVRFRNDQIARIMEYGDYQLGNVTISRVYYIEGLGHNLYPVGQFCDADLEVALRKNTCFIRNLEGVDLLSRSRDTNLYTISLDDMLKTSSICLLSKASKTKAGYGTIACALGKSKKSSHQPKAEDINQEKLYLLHMDLCVLIFLRTKDEAPEAIIKCIKNIQVRLNATVRNVQTDNGTEFVNQTLREFYENVGISHQTFVARTPQQNGVVERQNRNLIEAARTMLIFSKAPLFLWSEAINTACYTQNRSLISLRYNKTPYELMQDKKPGLSFFNVFGSLCYPTNDNDDLGKLDAKADIGTPAKKALRIYNKRTQKIIETIYVTFDELVAMASKQFSSGPGLHSMTPATSSSGLVSNPVSQQPCIPPKRDDLDRLFQHVFDEYFNPPSIVVSPVQEAIASRAVVLADSPVSTSIDQDASSASIPSTQEQEHSPNISQGFEESQKTPFFHDDTLYESLHEDSTSQGSSSNLRQIHTLFEHLDKWTKDHPIANVIGDPSRFVSTRKQLQTVAMWCYFDAFLTSVEPKNFK
ncbi:retrovirus-related pol polyprotein from transposon TNT 1-94 [Tanacetum coccineum]